MALSGTLYAYSGNITLKVIWTATQSVANNTSTIKVETHIVHTTGQIKLGSAGSANLMNQKTWSIPTYQSTTYSDTNYHDDLLNTTTNTITHNADGTLSGTLTVSLPSVSYWMPGKAEAKTGTLTASGTIVLDTIARATQPTLSATSVAMGSALTISMPRASSGFTHTLSYSFGSATGTIGSGLGTSQAWTVPLTLASQIPNATSGTLTINCATYNGTTLIGTKSVTVKVTVPASVVPTISQVAVSDPTGVQSTYGYVKTKSKFTVKVTAAGAYSSTIKTYKIVANGVTYTENNITTGFLAIAGANTITATVTDSRGRTATSSVSVTVYDYYPPTIKNFTAVRSNSSGTADPNGTYLVVNGTADIASVNGKNGGSIKVQYRIQGTTSWTSIYTSTSGQAWTVSQKTAAANEDSMYEVQIVVTDKWTSAEKTMLVPTVYTIMDFKADGKGIAFGKVSTQDGFDVNMESRFRKNVMSDLDVYAGYGTTEQVSLKSVGAKVNNLINRGYSLLRPADIGELTTTEKTYATFNNRKISDYDIINFSIGASDNDVRATMTVPRTIFDGTNDEGLIRTFYIDCWSNSGQNFHHVCVRYVSDTQIKAWMSYQNSATKILNVYGIKILDKREV